MHIQIFPIAEADVVTLVKSIDRVVINPVIFFLFAIAMVYFLYGLTRYFLSPDSTEVRDASKAQMIWGVAGLFIMVAVFGILQVILNTFGISNVKIQSNGDYNVAIPDSTISNSNYNVVAAQGATQYNLNGNSSTPNSTALANPTNAVSNSTTAVAGSNPLVYAAPVNGDVNQSPLTNNYTSTALCWRAAVSGNDVSEYTAAQSVQNIARADYLSATGQSDQTAPASLPIVEEKQTIFDPTTKNFYVWLGVVAPLGQGTLSDCKILPSPSAASTKLNPFIGQYGDTASMYEIIDSAVDPVLANAKNAAIQNALIQIAQEEGLTSTANISYTVVDGKYYPPDSTTQNYDYWVVVESPK
jgi:hypothetical protein